MSNEGGFVKSIVILSAFALLIAVSVLSAQEINLGSLLSPGTASAGDTLTSNYSAFVHTNWSQAGIGINIKNIMIMFNSTVLPATKNYKSDLDTSILTAETDYEVKHRYTVLMAGYIFRIGKNLYPFAGSGTALMTDMIEVRDTTYSQDVFTIKGKEVTYGTGIIGAFYTTRKNFFITGSIQLKPLLPFVGAGIMF